MKNRQKHIKQRHLIKTKGSGTKEKNASGKGRRAEKD